MKNKWFSSENHDFDEDNLQICHFTDFLADNLPGYKKSNPKSPEDFKHSMKLIGEKLNQNNKTIVMVDELCIDFAFKKSQSKKISLSTYFSNSFRQEQGCILIGDLLFRQK